MSVAGSSDNLKITDCPSWFAPFFTTKTAHKLLLARRAGLHNFNFEWFILALAEGRRRRVCLQRADSRPAHSGYPGRPPPNHRPQSIAGIDYGLLARAGFAEQDGWPSFHHTGPRFAAGTPTLTNSPQTKAGTFFYHSHDHPDRQQGLGLYGAFIIDPRERGRDESKADLAYVIQLQKWLVRDRLTHPAMLMEGGLPNYFTINRRAYPSTDVVHMKVGPTVKLRFIGTSNNFIHTMHVHGGPFTIVARDGVTLSPSARYDADTINLGPGQRYDVIWPTRRPGKWLIHCHIPHHTENDNVEEKRWGRTDDVDRYRRQLEWLRRMAGATEIQAREQG